MLAPAQPRIEDPQRVLAAGFETPSEEGAGWLHEVLGVYADVCARRALTDEGVVIGR